ncbi:chemotaxis protein CheX [Cellulomonas wangsupingiae]|uniref:Chemotaxis protein CheX n=1 Tax=Cellulomonas wangsupingiae TaxID=2968085 RepID=A0ABY5KBU9_9CELL|nr:chemotaxis protein CheX [Cellulomonas wangsupingiae]MCC2334179.1 chemotaxis protein CheX [Cellulomonas wangsupingiae]UUI65858.1 chemotaxis protein CheX [Cellulomonas wangsupingiae]
MSTTTDVYAVAEALFATLVDGRPGTLRPWTGDGPAWSDPVVAWVDLHGGWTGRAAVTAESGTADDLARALLDLPTDDPVAADDVRDAFGEVANVVGGSVKALLPAVGAMGLPTVAAAAPALPGSVLVAHVLLDWRGRALELTVRGTSAPAGPREGGAR